MWVLWFVTLAEPFLELNRTLLIRFCINVAKADAEIASALNQLNHKFRHRLHNSGTKQPTYTIKNSQRMKRHTWLKYTGKQDNKRVWLIRNTRGD